MGLSHVGPLICGFFSIHIFTINEFSLPYDFNKMSLSLASFTVKTEYMIYITYQIHVNQLFMLSLRLLVNSKLITVNFRGSQKLYTYS